MPDYKKTFTPRYRFPGPNTVAFQGRRRGRMRALVLPRGPVYEADNDRARWPCFFPAPLLVITVVAEDGRFNMMPCGSTMMVNRHPLTIAASIAYAEINVRYRRRETLEMIERAGVFGVCVFSDQEHFVEAVNLSGNLSIADGIDKFRDAGLTPLRGRETGTVLVKEAPVCYECRLAEARRLGTHKMLFGEVLAVTLDQRIARGDTRLLWHPLAKIVPAEQ